MKILTLLLTVLICFSVKILQTNSTCEVGTFESRSGNNTECIRCSFGKFGANCSRTCVCNDFECDAIKGTCFCGFGKTGIQCEKDCPEGTYGKNCSENCKCLNGAMCDPRLGSCTCSPGFIGTFCGSVCPDGKFGQNCSQSCKCENGGKCAPQDGECDCTPGFFGNICNNECTANKFGKNCSETCKCLNGAICSHIDGSCTCTAGFAGTTCADDCPDGKYGLQCKGNCPACSEYERCDLVNGICKECPVNAWGRRCEKVCSCPPNSLQGCGAQNGECKCNAGYTGSHCNETCSSGYYGSSCALRCTFECPDYAYIECNPKSGSKCICKPGITEGECEVIYEPSPSMQSGNVKEIILGTLFAIALLFLALCSLYIARKKCRKTSFSSTNSHTPDLESPYSQSDVQIKHNNEPLYQNVAAKYHAKKSKKSPVESTASEHSYEQAGVYEPYESLKQTDQKCNPYASLKM